MVRFAYMRISDHYQAFEKKTVIALTNNERCRLLIAHHRDIEEVDGLEAPGLEQVVSAATNRPADSADLKDPHLTTLYHALSEKLRSLLAHDGLEQVVICVPEINKNILLEALHVDVKKALLNTIPKNLASMDLANIIRILMES